MVKTASAQTYQHGIIGGGCAGMQMLQALLNHPATQKDQIIVFEPELMIPDKSWCFWTKEEHIYKGLVENYWAELTVRAENQLITQKIAPYQYQYISSLRFFAYHYHLISKHANVFLLREKVLKVTPRRGHFDVETDEHNFRLQQVYDSRPDLNTGSPELWQHFLGWQIQTEKPIFDTTATTIMDFYKDDGSFVYLLPFEHNRALIEYTYFSDRLFPLKHYHALLKDFMAERYPQTNYISLAEEHGKIPMSREKFTGVGSAGQWLIGTAAGMTKATTGYTFTRITKDCAHIAATVAAGKSAIANRGTTGRFLFYDRLLLGILRRKPSLLQKIMH